MGGIRMWYYLGPRRDNDGRLAESEYLNSWKKWGVNFRIVADVYSFTVRPEEELSSPASPSWFLSS